jgi:hypothetical protein
MTKELKQFRRRLLGCCGTRCAMMRRLRRQVRLATRYESQEAGG